MKKIKILRENIIDLNKVSIEEAAKIIVDRNSTPDYTQDSKEYWFDKLQLFCDDGRRIITMCDRSMYSHTICAYTKEKFDEWFEVVDLEPKKDFEDLYEVHREYNIDCIAMRMHNESLKNTVRKLLKTIEEITEIGK